MSSSKIFSSSLSSSSASLLLPLRQQWRPEGVLSSARHFPSAAATAAALVDIAIAATEAVDTTEVDTAVKAEAGGRGSSQQKQQKQQQHQNEHHSTSDASSTPKTTASKTTITTLWPPTMFVRCQGESKGSGMFLAHKQALLRSSFVDERLKASKTKLNLPK
jgi:hypothetical protein